MKNESVKITKYCNEKSSLKYIIPQRGSILNLAILKMLRCIIRDLGIIAKPYKKIPLMALGRTHLDHDLVNVLFTATETLREKCPNTEFFLVRLQENTDQKKICIWTFFTQ